MKKKKGKKFVIVCPTCGKHNKVLKGCLGGCAKYVCSECSIDGLCHDCYLEQKRSWELGVYLEDKYDMPSLSEDEYVEVLVRNGLLH